MVGRGGRGGAGATAGIGHLDLEAVAGGFAAVVVVGEQAQVGVGYGLPIAHRRTVVFQGAVCRQARDLHGVGAVVGVGNGQAAARTANHRDGAAHQRHIGFALDQHDGAAGAGRLVARGDVHGHHLAGEDAARAIVHGDGEAVGGGGQHLRAVVLVGQLAEVADGKRGAGGELVAVE